MGMAGSGSRHGTVLLSLCLLHVVVIFFFLLLIVDKLNHSIRSYEYVVPMVDDGEGMLSSLFWHRRRVWRCSSGSVGLRQA